MESIINEVYFENIKKLLNIYNITQGDSIYDDKLDRELKLLKENNNSFNLFLEYKIIELLKEKNIEFIILENIGFPYIESKLNIIPFFIDSYLNEKNDEIYIRIGKDKEYTFVYEITKLLSNMNVKFDFIDKWNYFSILDENNIKVLEISFGIEKTLDIIPSLDDGTYNIEKGMDAYCKIYHEDLSDFTDNIIPYNKKYKVNINELNNIPEISNEDLLKLILYQACSFSKFNNCDDRLIFTSEQLYNNIKNIDIPKEKMIYFIKCISCGDIYYKKNNYEYKEVLGKIKDVKIKKDIVETQYLCNILKSIEYTLLKLKLCYYKVKYPLDYYHILIVNGIYVYDK